MKAHTLVLASSLLIATACNSRHNSASDSSSAMPVDVASAVTDSVVLHKTYPGYIEAATKVDVVARVNGTLERIHYAGGDYVKKGQLLFTIEDTRYRDAATQAQAQLSNAKSALAYAKSHYEAVKKALESDAVSQMEVIQAESALHQAEASVTNSQAALQTANTNLGYCRITAPISGYITASIPGAGAYVGGEGAPMTMATVYDDAKVNATFYIEDEQYIRIVDNEAGPGAMRIDLTCVPLNFSETLPHTYTGSLAYVDPTLEKSTGTMKLQCTVENPYNELKNGMYVTVDLPYAVEPRAILVRDASIGTDQLGRYLYVVNDSNRVVYTPVSVGELVADSMRIVTKGILPGQRYVTKALLKVRNGMEIRPITEN